MAKLLINVTHGPEHPPTFCVSGMSSKARGFEPDDGVEPTQPGKLVELALEADRVLTY
jgi:hypothetical protein